MTFLSVQLRSTKIIGWLYPGGEICVTGCHVTSRNQGLSSNDQGRQRRETWERGCPSTSNKIERWWGELHERLEKFFKEQLVTLLRGREYDPHRPFQKRERTGKEYGCFPFV